MSSIINENKCWRCKATKDSNWVFCPACSARLVDTRRPSPPNPAIDIAFLYDLYSFGWYNRHVGAVALYEAAASIDHFYDSKVTENYRLEVEPPRAQKILRAKIFAEFIGFLEAFGVLCLAIAKRKQQSFMWTFLNTEPQEVTAFYDRVLSYHNPPSLQRLLALPSISDIKKAKASHSHTPIASLPDNIDQITIEQVIYDYKEHGPNIVLMAKLYREQGSRNVRIYNKIKHIFPIVEGHNWLNPPLDPQQAAIAIDDTGVIARLPMEQEEVDLEITNIRLTTITGAELIALCIVLYQLGVL